MLSLIRSRPIVALLGALAFHACDSALVFPGGVITGTWGGDNAGLQATDTSAHIHIGCTYGNVHQPIVEGPNGSFDVPGEQDITAYPIDNGVLHPARFHGAISGRMMTLTVTLTDTAVTLGPVSLTYGKDPVLGPCPICFVKAKRRP
jgi:hypothetical protein